MIEAVPPSAVFPVEPCFAGSVLASELAGAGVALNNVGLEPDADDEERPLVVFVKGLVAVSAAFSVGLLRFENTPPGAFFAEDEVAELVAAPTRFPNILGAPIPDAVALAPESCAEVAGIAEGRLNVGLDEV